MSASTNKNSAPAAPTWDLSDLYASPDDPALERDLAAAEADAKNFNAEYVGKTAGLSPSDLGQAILAYEGILERAFKISSFAQLLHAAKVDDANVGRFHQMVQERVNGVTGLLLFFVLEINKLDDDAFESRYADETVARYRPWLESERQMRPYQLSDELEQFIHDKSVTGSSAWGRLFDETMADLRFPFAEEKLSLGDTLNRLTDRDPDIRAKAGAALSAGLTDRIRLFSLVTNTLAKDKEIEDTKRGLKRPMSGRNLANQVEDEVVDALATAVENNFERLSHRYYAFKARWFGVDKLHWWNRNAPFPKTEERAFTWDQAKDTVLGAYDGFAPEMAATAQQFFDGGWIDASARPGKNSGAFAHPVVPSAHPYVLMNFYGKPRDVMTLAHELGHGVHQVLAGPQGTLLSHTPLTLAETASVFGEMLTFRALLNAETDPKRKRVMLASKVEDMLNTVVRQTAFHLFETKLHDARRKGELTADDIGDIWMETQSASLGPALDLDDAYRPLWAYIPHFIHTPFYVYAYAFGDCLVNALYGLYQNGHARFQDKYFDMLKAGGTLRHKALLAPFGLDASDPKFWTLGLDVISGFIDELEADLPG